MEEECQEDEDPFQKAYRDAYAKYKSYDYVEALNSFKEIVNTKEDNEYIKKSNLILAKLHLFKGDHTAAIEYLLKCNTEPPTLRLIVKSLIHEYDKNRSEYSLLLAECIIDYILKLPSLLPLEGFKTKILLLEICSKLGNLIEFRNLLHDLIGNIEKRRIPPKHLLNIANVISKPCKLFDLMDDKWLIKKRKLETDQSCVYPLEVTEPLKPNNKSVDYCRKLSLTLHNQMENKCQLDIKITSVYEVLIQVMNFITGVDVKKNFDVRLNVLLHNSPSMDLVIPVDGGLNQNYTRQGQREAKRRVINILEGASTQIQTLKKFWSCASSIFKLPNDIFTVDFSFDGTINKSTSLELDEDIKFYPSDVVKYIKSSTSYYNLRHLNKVLSESPLTHLSDVTTKAILSREFTHNFDGCEQNISDFALKMLDFLLKNYKLFKKHIVNYSICICYLYLFIHQKIADSQHSDEEISSVTKSIYKCNQLKILNSDAKSMEFTSIHLKYGTRFLFIVYKSLKIYSVHVHKLRNELTVIEKPDELLKKAFDLAMIYSLQLTDSGDWKVLKRAQLIFIHFKRLLLDTKFKDLIQTYKEIKLALVQDRVHMRGRRDKLYPSRGGNKISDCASHLDKLIFGLYSSPTASGHLRALNDLSSRLFTALLCYTDLSYLRNIHKSGSENWSIDQHGWSSIIDIYERSQNINAFDTEFCNDLEDALIDATSYIMSNPTLPKWIWHLLLIFGDCISLYALNLHKSTSNIQIAGNSTESSLNIIKRFGTTSGLICTIVCSLLCIINKLGGLCQSIELYPVKLSQEMGPLKDTKIHSSLSYNMDFLKFLYNNYQFIQDANLSTDLYLTIHPILSRILVAFVFIINTELHTVIRINRSLTELEDAPISYFIFSSSSQICMQLLTSIFNVRITQESAGMLRDEVEKSTRLQNEASLKLQYPSLVCLVDGISTSTPSPNGIPFANYENILDDRIFYSMITMVDVLVQLDSFYTNVPKVPVEYIPDKLKRFMNVIPVGTEFANDKVHLDFLFFCLDKLLNTFDVKIVESFDRELNYILNSKTIHTLDTTFLEDLKDLFDRRRKMRNYYGNSVLRNTNKLNLQRPSSETGENQLNGTESVSSGGMCRQFSLREHEMVFGLIQNCFSLIYKNLPQSSVTALLSLHLNRNFSAEPGEFDDDTIIFLSDRMDKEFAEKLKDFLDKMCLLYDSDAVIFSRYPDPLIASLNELPTQDYDPRMNFYFNYIRAMNNLVSQDLFNNSSLLPLVLGKPTFRYPPSFKGVYMKYIKQLAFIDFEDDCIVTVTHEIDEILCQLDVITITSAIIPKSMDVWYCAAIKNFELFLTRMHINMPNFNHSRSFTKLNSLSTTSNTIPIIKRCLLLIDYNIQVYNYHLSAHNGSVIDSKYIDSKQLKADNIFFGEVQIGTKNFYIRLNRRLKLLLYSKCVILLHLLKMGIATPLYMLLNDFTLIISDFVDLNIVVNGHYRFILDHKLIRTPPVELIVYFVKRVIINPTKMNIEGMDVLLLRTEILKRILKVMALGDDTAFVLAAILISYRDYINLHLKSSKGAKRKRTNSDSGKFNGFKMTPLTITEITSDKGSQDPSLTEDHDLNSENVPTGGDDREKSEGKGSRIGKRAKDENSKGSVFSKMHSDLLSLHYKLHSTRLRLCYVYPELYYVAVPFRFNENNYILSENVLHEFSDDWLLNIRGYCQSNKITRDVVMKDCINALEEMKRSNNIDLSCKISYKMAYHYYLIADWSTSIDYNRQICQNISFPRNFMNNSVHANVGYLHNCNKITSMQLELLFDLLVVVLDNSRRSSIEERSNFMESVNNINRVDEQLDTKIVNIKKSGKIGNWVFVGCKSLDHLDGIYELIEVMIAILQKVNRKFKQIADTNNRYSETLVYVQNVVFSSLTSVFILLTNECPHCLSLPIMLDLMNINDVKALIQTDNNNWVSRTTNAVKDVLFSLIRSDLKHENIHQYLKDHHLLLQPSILVKYTQQTGTIDLRILKQLYTLWSAKLFQKPVGVTETLSRTFHEACKKLLYLNPLESVEIGHFTEVTFGDVNIRISDEWASTQQIPSPQKASVAFNEAIAKSLHLRKVVWYVCRSYSTSAPKLQLLECESVQELCNLYNINRTLWNHTDLITILSRVLHFATTGNTRDVVSEDEQENLWDSNEYCPIQFDKIKHRLNIMNLDKSISQIYTDVITKFDYYTTSEILYINKIGQYIKGYHNKIIRGDSERKLGSDLWNLDNVDLCRTATILVEKSNNIEFVKLFIHVILSKFKELTPKQRVLIFNTLSNSRCCSKLFLESATKLVLYYKDTFNDHDLVNILTCYAKKPSSCSGLFFKKLLRHALDSDFTKLELSDIYDLIWVTCKYTNDECSKVIDKTLEILMQNVKSMSSRNVTMLIWALANTNYKSIDLASQLENRAIETSESMTPTNISHCIHGLGALRTSGKFHQHIDGVIIENISHFNGLDLALIASGYVRLLTGSTLLHQCLQEACMKYLDDFPTDCITKILYSYALIGGKKSLFLSFQFPFMQRIHQFPLHELCTVLWSYIAMKIYDLSFWRFILSAINKDDVINEPRCTLLFPTLDMITKVHPALDTIESVRLMNHSRRYYWSYQLEKYNEYYIQSIVDILKLMGFEDIETCVDYSGHLIDLFFNKNYAVLLYSSVNTFGVNFKPTGDMLLKEDLLIRADLRIIRILYNHWKELDTHNKITLIKQQMETHTTNL